METKSRNESESPSIEAILVRVEASAETKQGEALKSYAHELLSRATPDFYVDRRDGEIEGIVASVFDLMQTTGPDEIGLRVYQRPDFGHWGSVEAVISDRPFVVDTLRQYLISKGFEIRHHMHPVVAVERDKSGKIKRVSDWRGKGQRLSTTYCEFEGHIDAAIISSLESDIRVCLEDLRLATDDFPQMLQRTDEVAARLRAHAERKPEDRDEIEEIAGFLEWLRDGGFVYLGYREYDFSVDDSGRMLASLVRGSGLGILRRETESAMWEPTPVDDMPLELRTRALQGPLLLVSKANSESHVHRRARMDYVGVKKLNEAGDVVGEFRFLGLFTWQAYSEPKWDIPLLRKKLRAVLAGANVPEGSHDYKAILALFNDMPLEELLVLGADDLGRQISAVLATEDTGDVRLVFTPDALGRGVNVTVILPKRNYTDEVRGRLRTEVSQALGGTVLNDHLSIGAGDTARLHFYISASAERAESVDRRQLQELVGSIVRTWKQRLRDALEERHDGATVHHLERAYFDSFSPAYVATVEVETAVEDIDRLEELDLTGLMQVALGDHENGGLNASTVRLFVRRGSMILADAMPVLENLGLRVIEADAMDVGSGTSAATIHTFVVQGPDSKPLDREVVGERLVDTLSAVAIGATDSDQFNQLVLTAGLTWQEVAVLRAYSAYAFQVGAIASRPAVSGKP
jgi:glutamate dehydrogenase